MKTRMQMVPAVGKRILPLLVLIVVGVITMAWQVQPGQAQCDPATGQNCATPAQSSKHNRPTRTPAPTPTSSPTATSTATATSTVTQTASPVPTATATSAAALGQSGAPIPPPTNSSPTQTGPSWLLLGGGAALFGAIIVVCFYLFLRRPLGLLPAIQDVSPDGKENATFTMPDGGTENFTVSWHDGLGSATVTSQDPGGFENTIGGKDINDLTGSGMS